MPVPFWLVGDSAWDVLYLDDVRIPGIASLTITPSRGVQVNKSKDENGTTLADNGYEGSKVNGLIRIWTQEQLEELEQLIPRWHPRNQDGVSRPISILHPAATLAGVRAIYIPTWTIPPPKDELPITFAALEWFPGPKPVNKTGAKNPAPASPAPGVAGGPATGGPPNFEPPVADPKNTGPNFP